MTVNVNHTFVEQTTEQTHTGDVLFTDITGAEITSGNFIAGNKYLIIANAQFGGSSIDEAFGIQTLHGSTAFAESNHTMEPTNVASTDYQKSYTWFTVWTAIASEGIKLQFKTFGSTETVKADQITLTVIELTEFTENTDWFFDFNSTSTALTTTFTSTNNASATFTPSVPSDWLVLSYDTIEPGNTNQYESRIETTGGISSTEPLTSIEGETDSGSLETDIFNDFITRAYSLTAVSHTFTQQARNFDSSAGSRTNSAIFAINLNKFKKHSFAYTEGTVAGTAGTSEVQTTSITPDSTSDNWVGSFFVFHPSSSISQTGVRMQVDNVDQPPTQTSDNYLAIAVWDGADLAPFFIQSVENLDNTAHNVDVDVFNTDTGQAYGNRLAFAVQLETALPTKPFTVNALLKASNQTETFLVDAKLTSKDELTFKFVEVTADQSHTGDANFADIPGATIDSSFFVTGRKYLIVVTTQAVGSNINTNYSVRTLHGSTELDGSEHVFEPNAVSTRSQYSYFNVWTAIAGEGIKMQFKTMTPAQTISADQTTLFALEISEDFVEGVDWHSDAILASTVLSTTPTVANNATITFTPPVAGDDWLVMTGGCVDTDALNVLYTSRTARSGEAVSTTPSTTQEGEDAPLDLYVQTVFRVFTLGNASNTFEQEAFKSGSQGPASTREYSSVFAINLDKFKSHSFAYTDGTITLDTTDNLATSTQVQTDTLAPTTAGFTWIMGSFVTGGNAFQEIRARMQVDNVDQVPTQTSDNYQQLLGYDPDDENNWAMQTVEDLDTSSHITDVDVSAEVGSPSDRTAQFRNIFEVRLEFAGVAVQTETFLVDAILKATQTETFLVDAFVQKEQEETFLVDAILSALEEFTVDARLVRDELFTVDAKLVRDELFTVDARLVRDELFTVDARLAQRELFTVDSRLSALAEFDIDTFIELEQIVNFTVDALIQGEITKFFLIDAFIQNTFVEDFFIDSRLSALAEFTVDAKLVRNELFTVDARLSALAEFTVDARLSALAEFTVDSRLSALAEFTVDSRLSALAEFTVDSRLSALAEFTVDGRLAVRELFTVDARLSALAEFTVDAFVQALDQEETFLVDARLRALTSILVIVDAFIKALNQEETFFVDALIQTEDIDKTFLVDARLKGEQEETFFIDAFIEDTFDEDFLVDAFIKALNQEETFLVDSQLANIIAETFTVDVLTQGEQTKPFLVDSRLAQRVDEDFTVDALIAFRETFTIDATLSPRETFTVDGKLKFTVDEEFLIDGIPLDAGKKLYTVDALIQKTFDETFTIDAIIIDVVQETFFVDSFIQALNQEETFFVDARTQEINSKIFNVNAIIKALDTNKTFTVDTFSETVSLKLITVDAFIQKTQTETTQVDAKVREVIDETFIIDAFIQDTFTKTFSVDGILIVAGQKVFMVDALIQTSDIDKTFTIGAVIQVVQIRPWQIDAIITTAQAETFTVDAQIFLPTLENFTVDGFLIQPVTLFEFTVDARIEELATQVFTINSILTDAGQKVFTVDGSTLGTQTKDFTVSANIRFENQEIFDVDALIKLTGDVLCAGISGEIFNDDISTDTNWTVTGTQILVDDPSFPNVIRMECLQSFLAPPQQAVKQLDSTIINFKAQDLVFDFDHLQIFECTGGFRANGILELSETSTQTEIDPSQARIRYRILSSGPQPAHFARLEVSDGTTTVVSSSFQLINNFTFFVRISIVNNGTDARIEFFGSPARITPLSLIPDIDISSLTGKPIGFVQVANVGGGGGLRRLRGEFDNLLVTATKLCPEFRVDSVLKGEIEKNFTVDSVLVELTKFTVDAILDKLGALQLFTIDAFIGTPEVTFTIDALLKTQGKFTVDAFIEETFTETVQVDAHVKALNQEVLFTINAQIIRAVQYDVDGFLALRTVEPFTVDARLSGIEEFDIDSTLRNRFDEQFLIDGSTLGTVEKDFTIDGILIVFPSGVILVDSIIQAQDNDKTFTVDSQLFKAGTDFDFTVDTFILRTGDQLCDPSQITSFPDLTEDFSSYTNQTEADTAWVPADIGTAQVDITNDLLGVIQVNDTSNDAVVFDLENALGELVDGQKWTLRYKLVINSVTNTITGALFNEGFFGLTTSAGDSQASQTSIGINIRTSVDSNVSQFRSNRSSGTGIYPMIPGGNFNVQKPVTGTYFIEIKRTGSLNSEHRIFSDANYTNLLDQANFSLGFIAGNLRFLTYKNRSNTTVSPGLTDFTIDDIQFWNAISDVSISSCPRVDVDAIIQTPEIDKEFIVDAVIKLTGENGICNFFPGTNFAIDTGLEQFIGPIRPAHEGLVEQLVGQEVTLSNQQVRSVNFLLRSSNFPNEITTTMPINAEIWSDVVIGNLGGETTEAVSTTVIDAVNTSGDLPPGDWTLVKFEFDINTTPFLTGDFVVGYRGVSSVFSPAGVGTAIPVISNSNVISGSAVHRKGANSALGDLDEWIFLTSDQKDMIIQLEVVNGDEIILGVGKQCPPVDAILVNVPNKFLIDAIVVRRFTNDFIIDGLIDPPVLVPFLIDGFLIGTKLPFSVDSILIPSQVIFTVDGILTGAGQKVFLIDAVLQPFIEFEIDALVQALETKSPKFNLNALLVVEDREIDFTVDGSTKFFDQVAPFTIDAFVIFFPSRLPFVDGIIKELGALQPFTVDAFIQQLDFNFIRTIDALLQKGVGKNFLADALIETKDTEEDFTIDARLSTPGAPVLFTVDGLMLLENHRWRIDALLQKRVITTFTLDGLIVALPQKLFLVDASTLGTIDETFIIDGLIEIEAQEPFLVDARILQINTVDFTVDAIIKGVGLTLDFTVDSSLVRIGEFTVDSFVKATQIKTFTIDARVGRFEKEIIGVDAIIKAFNQEKEFTVDAKVAFVKEAGFTVDTQLIGSQDFTVSAFVGDTLFVILEVESVIVENNSNEGVESVIVENNSDEGVESVIGQGD